MDIELGTNECIGISVFSTFAVLIVFLLFLRKKEVPNWVTFLTGQISDLQNQITSVSTCSSSNKDQLNEIRNQVTEGNAFSEKNSLNTEEKVKDLTLEIRRFNNSSMKGGWSDQSCSRILEDFLNEGKQFIKQVQIKEGSLERVDFALLLPSGDTAIKVPIDSKFPQTPYLDLVKSREQGDPNVIKVAQKKFDNEVKAKIRDITKYINPPITTNFAIMFVPSESLNIEIINIVGIRELLRDKRIRLVGPSNIMMAIDMILAVHEPVIFNENAEKMKEILPRFQEEHKLIVTFGKQIETVVTTRDKIIAYHEKTEQIMSKLGFEVS